MKSVAILQPYFFPYLGHFQLIDKVDYLVIYDDVNFFKKGYINRNYILNNNEPTLYTIPISKMSQNKKINELNYFISNKELEKKIKFFYGREKNLLPILDFLNKIFSLNNKNVSRINTRTLIYILKKLETKTKILFSSKIKKDNQLKGQNKIIDICKKINANLYINLAGGKKLYDQKIFNDNSISLKFLKPELTINEDFINYNNKIYNLSTLHHMIMFDNFKLRKKISKGFICD